MFPLKVFLVHETAPGHKAQGDREHKGLALTVAVLLLLYRTAPDLCASQACGSLICAARGSAKEQRDLSPGCWTEITSGAARLPLWQAVTRAGEEQRVKLI